jgi:hypothetical protein
MATQTVTSGAHTGPRPWRLHGGARRATLVTHVLSSVGWIGIDIALLVLAVTGLTSDDPLTVAACYQAMGVFVLPTVVPAALVCLASGVLLGMGSRYGLVRYWWVVVKLVINVVLTVLVLVLLRPGLGVVADAGRAADLDTLAELGVGMVFPPAVSIAALTVATVLAFTKPWGRIRSEAVPR